ncbi:MAG: SAM-dependent methyltransferase [Rhodospirillaceae bacterium]|jgi:predicted O-methyltransferase YrrM|nr:SAM-dependent methyltransferase [Rhodospirillaceae bacterium]
MAGAMQPVGREILEYLRSTSLREIEPLRGLRAATDAIPESGWEAAPEQAQFLALLVQITGARRVLEVGTFTGYSTLAMAAALPEGGALVTCDMVEDYVNVGVPFWRLAGVDGLIEVRYGAALDTLAKMIDDGEKFDMAFIDANKKDYDTYYEQVLQLLPPGGLIAFDNVFWDCKVLDESRTEKSTVALRALNQKLHGDDRVSISMLPLNDGMTICWKRP